MPIVFNAVTNAFVLRCVNVHPNPQPLTPIDGVKQLVSGEIFGENGPLVRSFFCSVCGYVETYLAKSDEIEAPGG